MKLPILPLTLLAMPFMSPMLHAASNPASVTEKDQTQTAPAKPGVSVSGPTSRVSNGLAASITSTLPKYTPPPPPPPPAPETAEPEGVMGEDGTMEISDPNQPHNKIIRLPKYIVQGEKPPIFKERELYTKKGLAALAAKRYLSKLDTNGLNKFTLPLIGMTPEQRAMMMYEEDERLQNMSDLKDAANLAAKAGNKEEADFIRKESNSTFLRSGGMDWTSRTKD